MGCGVIPWLIAPELLPLYALPPGSALANASNWLFNFVINTVWPEMNNNLGDYSFIVFAVINFVGFLFILICMPETTGRNLDQQQQQLKPAVSKQSQEEAGLPGVVCSENTDKLEDIHHIETTNK